MQTHSSGSVFRVFCWFDLKRHKDPVAGLWGLNVEERDLQVKRLMKRGNQCQAREMNATRKAANTALLFVSPSLCSPLCLLHIDLAFLFPLCMCVRLPLPWQETKHEGKEQSAQRCFMWIQELNLALACVLSQFSREQKGNAARDASSTIVWAHGHPSALTGEGQGMGTERLLECGPGSVLPPWDSLRHWVTQKI